MEGNNANDGPPPELPAQFSNKAVGRRLKIFRLGLGKTQEQMAKKYGSGGEGQMWSHYERAIRIFPLEIANQLTLEYSLDIAWVYQGNKQLLVGRPAEIVAKGEEEYAKRQRKGRKRK
jgi:transcriptional regulator with XRE-family HTH domain